MKKSKIIAIALAAAITFMGAGYAAWTDSVEINTAVETGTVDVQFTDDYLTPDDVYNNNIVNHELTHEQGKNVLLSGKDNALNVKDAGHIENNGKLLTLSVENLYPINQEGAIENPGAWYFCPIKNMGSIPVKFDNSVITFKISDGKKEVSFKTLDELKRADQAMYTKYESFLKNLDCDLTILYSENPGSGKISKWEVASWELTNFNIMNLNTEISKLFNGKDAIEKEGKIGLLFTTHLKKEAPNNTQNKGVQIDIQLNWKQFNK